MIKKIKKLLDEFRSRHNKTQKQLSELEWANIFHDSIRDSPEINQLSLNIGRWAGNYSFFYILNRILRDYKPNYILEFGLGESSKLISTYITNNLTSSKYLIIEHNKEWKDHFLSRFNIPESVCIKEFKLITSDVFGHKVYSYDDIESVYDNDIDFFLIDGPFGSKRYSRFDIVKLVKCFNKSKKFIILIDDYQRQGEKETSQEVLNHLNELKIPFEYTVVKGIKEQIIISSKHYKYLHSI